MKEYIIRNERIINNYIHTCKTVERIECCPMCDAPFVTAIKSTTDSGIYLQWECNTTCKYDSETGKAAITRSDKCLKWWDDREPAVIRIETGDDESL